MAITGLAEWKALSDVAWLLLNEDINMSLKFAQVTNVQWGK